MTRKPGAFYRDLPTRKNFKIHKHPHKWHICICAITQSSARAKSKEPFSGKPVNVSWRVKIYGKILRTSHEGTFEGLPSRSNKASPDFDNKNLIL